MTNKGEISMFDEGVKEIMMSLFSMGALAYEAGYIADQLKKRPEPPPQKIEALSKAKKIKPNVTFDQAYKKLMDYYQSQPSKSGDKNIDMDELANFIMPSEIIGNNLNSPENKKYFSPYKDDVGLWTVGIGHLIGKGSDQDKNIFVSKYGNRLSSNQVRNLFKNDLVKHLNKTKAKFPVQWESFSPDLKKALVDISYRGDLYNPKSKEDFQFVKSIKNNDFKNAATQYLDHTEYKKRILRKMDGVVKRMNRNASIIAKELKTDQIVSR
jgi:GH24 family phage-related lysozyme (muramidase)